MAKRERRSGSSWGVAKFAPRKRSASKPCWKEPAALHLRLTSPAPVAEGSWHLIFPSDSGREIPETSSGLPVSSRPTFRWASVCKSRLWPALVGSQKCDQELALSGRAPCASIVWRISFREMPCVLRDWPVSLLKGSWLAQNRKTHPAPLQEAATKPGVLHSEA